MEKYYKKHQPQHEPVNSSTTGNTGTLDKSKALVSEYDQYHKALMDIDDDEGWASELRCYLKDRPADVSRDTDIVQWWQVPKLLLFQSVSCKIITGSCPTLPNPRTHHS
jgi:hypothetical protein